MPNNENRRKSIPATFKLRTQPFGASVYINEKFVGMARLDGIDLPWGQGEIVVQKDGYRTERLKFTAPPSEDDVLLELVLVGQAARKKKRTMRIGVLAVAGGLLVFFGAAFLGSHFLFSSSTDQEVLTLPHAATKPRETNSKPNPTVLVMDEITRLKQAAESGDANSQTVLGDRYRTGTGVDHDDKESVSWYKKAAEQGHVLAQLNLGWMIGQGRGAPKNHEEEALWYLRSAEQGNPNAQSNIGQMYLKGQGVPQSEKEALKWFSKAAEQGSAAGQFCLGWMLLKGKGVTKNEVEGVKLIQESAKQGHVVAQLNLGKLFESGTVVPRDYSEAVKWYRLSAEQGNSTAQSRLAMMYMQGRGVPLDRAEGQKWLEKSRVETE